MRCSLAVLFLARVSSRRALRSRVGFERHGRTKTWQLEFLINLRRSFQATRSRPFCSVLLFRKSFSRKYGRSLICSHPTCRACLCPSFSWPCSCASTRSTRNSLRWRHYRNMWPRKSCLRFKRWLCRLRSRLYRVVPLLPPRHRHHHLLVTAGALAPDPLPLPLPPHDLHRQHQLHQFPHHSPSHSFNKPNSTRSFRPGTNAKPDSSTVLSPAIFSDKVDFPSACSVKFGKWWTWRREGN